MLRQGITTHRCWVYGDNVNTDVIFSGKYTYTLVEPTEIAAHALEDLDPTFAGNVQADDIIIAGRNWGCGSSREQAVTALKYAGVPIIIAASFSRIYFRNCINQGILPIVAPDIVDLVSNGDVIIIDWDLEHINVADTPFDIPKLSPSVEKILAMGGLVPMLQQEFQENN